MSLNVLLIDDDVNTQEIFAVVAAYHGGRAIAVQNAEDALNYLERRQPDIIVIDLYLDKVNGYEILRQIRRSPFKVRCPIVATTAYYTPATLGSSVLSGFDGYLEKPFLAQELWPFLLDVILHARQRPAQTS